MNEAELLVEQRIRDGSIIQQKAWKFIKELNSVSEERLTATAIIDGEKRYSYRQFFRQWERYAEVFTALGMTEENDSKAGVMGVTCMGLVTSLYALNMVGTSVSGINSTLLLGDDTWQKSIEVEHITDLIIGDMALSSATLKKLLEKKEELGLRNIIVISTDPKGICTNRFERAYARMNHKMLRQVEGAVFMDDLLMQYETTPIHYAEKIDANAITVHTSGTTKGVQKPIPYSDVAFNAGALHFLQSEVLRPKRPNAISCFYMDLSACYGVVDQLHMPMAFGCATVLSYMAGLSPMFHKVIKHYGLNIWFTSTMVLEMMSQLPADDIDLSSLDMVAVGGAYMSAEARKKHNAFLKKCGADADLYNGYGLSECGGACIVSPAEREDDSIGFPLPGIKVKIYDEDEKVFYSVEDGPRSGTLYVASEALSSGRIGDEEFFGFTEVDGEKYLDTFDAVRVDEEGCLTYIGRANRFFTNTEGVQFNAGIIETAIAAQKGIKACAIVPMYNKVIHDTVPVLVVQENGNTKETTETVRRALKNVYIKDDMIAKTSLVNQVILVRDIPYNANQKVDVYKISANGIHGMYLDVVPVEKDSELVDIRLEKSDAQAMVFPMKQNGGLELMMKLFGPVENEKEIPEELIKMLTSGGAPGGLGADLLNGMEPDGDEELDFFILLMKMLKKYAKRFKCLKAFAPFFDRKKDDEADEDEDWDEDDDFEDDDEYDSYDDDDEDDDEDEDEMPAPFVGDLIKAFVSGYTSEDDDEDEDEDAYPMLPCFGMMPPMMRMHRDFMRRSARKNCHKKRRRPFPAQNDPMLELMRAMGRMAEMREQAMEERMPRRRKKTAHDRKGRPMNRRRR